jgi:FKBP-type peptidyl-prolyl cis-trans isomerase
MLPSGVRIKLLRKGTGTIRPSAESVIQVHYAGWMRDGKRFDTSMKRDRPATFKISGIIPGWQHAMREMVAGDIARIWIPADLAFGDVPKRAGAPVGQLTFDVELISVD